MTSTARNYHHHANQEHRTMNTAQALAARLAISVVALIVCAGLLVWGCVASVLASPARPTVAACGETVTVQPGDTLNLISKLTARTVDELVDVNSIADPDVIDAGQILELCDGDNAEPVPAPAAEPVPKPPAGPKEIGATLAAKRGWTGQQWKCLETLWQRESGWNPTAQNPTSTAYGIAQFLNQTWATVGAVKTADTGDQIQAGLDYIAQRYETPCGAWSHWINETPHHWY